MKDRDDVAAAFARLEESTVKVGQLWRHQVTDSLYEVTELSVDEVRLAPLVTYRSVAHGYRWTRDLDAFLGANELGMQRFVPADPGEQHYAQGVRCKRCGSSELDPHGMGSEIFRHSCRTCGADPA